MIWMVHPTKQGGSEGSLPSFPSVKGKIPNRNGEEGEDESDEEFEVLPLSKSLDLAISQNKHLTAQERSFSLEIIRLKTQKFMASSWFGRVYFNFFLVVSIFSCGQYIYQTYLNHDEKLISFFLTVIEIILAAMFLFDWCLSLFLAEQRWDHFWSFFALVDFATIVPTILVNIFFRHSVSYHEIKTFRDGCNYFTHGAYTLRILRALRVQKKLLLIKDEVDRFFYSLLLSIITMVLFDAAVMQYLEAHVQDLPFHTWMYYTVVTICTVGYGDISPSSTLGRFACMFIILFAIVYLPQQTNELIEKMSIFSVYARRNYVPIGQAKHVIICGDLRTTFLLEFFSELFHEDHENMNLNAVVLQPESPSPEMHAILRDTNFGIVVHYLAGSPLNNNDLQRARVDIAVAIFIMGNKFSTKPDEDDAKTILQFFSIQRYLRSQPHQHHFDPLYCMQLIRPDNKRHLGEKATDEDSSEIIICLNEMKMGLIAKTCMFPGTNTLIFNLLTSFADNGEGIDEEEEELQKIRQEISQEEQVMESKKKLELAQLQEGSDEESEEKSKRNPLNVLRRLSSDVVSKLNHTNSSNKHLQEEQVPNEDNSDTDSDASVKGNSYWMNEYQKGCDWEIYTTEMSEKFEGIKFIDLARSLYTKLGVVLFGIRVTDLNLVTNRVRVILNPADFIIPPKSKSIIEGFVLAKNQGAANLSFTGGMSFDGSHLESIANSLMKTPVTQGPGLRKRVSISGHNPIVTAPKLGHGWQTLLGANKATHFQQQEEMHQSRQEREQKLERDNLRNNFFVREFVDLSECTIKTSLTEEYPFIREHMIVIAKGISNLYDFIRPLRAKYLGKLKHIVLLYPFDIPVNIWRKLSEFEGILFVRGSPLEENDIKRAGIFRATQVVVLASPDVAASNDSGMDELVDADAIFTYHCVKRLNEKAQIVIEVVRQQNISYLESKSSDIDYKFTPNFACGMLFASSMLDAVVCQAFYNPQIISVLKKLISGTDHIPEKGGENRSFGMDKSYSRSIGLKAITGSSLYQIAIPNKFHNHTYGQLFDHYSKDNCLCIALLRGLQEGTSIGPTANRQPYVFTNPPLNTYVYRWDRVFVLSPKVLTSTNSTIKEVLESYAHANNCVAAKRADDSAEHAAKNDLTEISTTQRTIEIAVSRLTLDVSNRFEELLTKQKNINQQFLPNLQSNQQPHKPIDRSHSRTLRVKEEVLRQKSKAKKSELPRNHQPDFSRTGESDSNFVSSQSPQRAFSPEVTISLEPVQTGYSRPQTPNQDSGAISSLHEMERNPESNVNHENKLKNVVAFENNVTMIV